MSIFGSIVSKIFGHAAASPAPASPPPTSSTSASTAAPAPAAPPSSSATSFNNPVTTAQAPGSVTSAPSPQPANANQNVDVAAILDTLLSANSQQLDWRHSIVDLMKLLGLDSSLSAREELAKELHYTGAMDGSAAMNLWLHKQVMRKLAENGGKVPDELK